MEKEITLDKIFHKLRKMDINSRPRLFYLKDNEILLCFMDRLEHIKFKSNHGLINDLELDRGEVLDIFSKIEFIINNIIFFHINPNNYKEFSKITDKINFSRKIELLKSWKIINKQQSKEINKVFVVRNSMAHAWSIEKVKYNNHTLEENFNIFKKDLLVVWEIIFKIQTDKKFQLDEEFLQETFNEIKI